MGGTVPPAGERAAAAGGGSWGLALLLARRQVLHRPWRSLLLLAGYGLGVAVMIVLLSVGEAMVRQAGEERLVGGGDVTVLPEGIDIEVMKTGGLGGLFFSIANARFVALQLLGAPRLADAVQAVAPQVDNKLLYLTTPGGRELPVKAAGEIPSATRAVGGLPPVVAGAWEDDAADARWLQPTPAELVHDIDHFHLPPPGIAQRESWAEWHYFNVLTPDRRRWAFINLIVGGAVPDGEWGGQLLVTLHEVGRPARRFSARVPREAVRLSTTDANLRVGAGSVVVDSAGRYAVRLALREERTGAPLAVDLTVAPTPRAYFPGASLGSGDFVSGYAVPGLRADASGTICAPGWCERFDGAQGYHDHNWGTWRGVTWDWGAARVGDHALLYGRVHPPDSLASESPLFLYVVDSLGFRGLFRPRRVEYVDGRRAGGVAVPSRAVLRDVRGGDTVEVVLDIDDATATDMRRTYVERGDASAARTLRRPWFVQMAGRARLRAVIGGRRVEADGAGFFETYR